MTVLNCLIILAMMALQIFNIVDFFEMLPAIHILIIVNGFVSVKKALTIYEANIEKRTYEKVAYSDNFTFLRNRRGFDDDLDAIDKDLDEVIRYCRGVRLHTANRFVSM